MTYSAILLTLSLAAGQVYCPEGSCGVGVGAGVQIGRLGIGAGVGVGRAPNVGTRPRNERLFVDGMVHVDGGLGIHVGDNMILTCTHGSKETVTYNGVAYRCQILAESPREDADVSVLYVSGATFRHVALVADSNPPVGTRVQWQGGSGVIESHYGNYSWVRGRCRYGDSGSPVFSAGRIVGVISGTNETHVNIGNVNGIQAALATARSNHPMLRGQPQSAEHEEQARSQVEAEQEADRAKRAEWDEYFAQMERRIKELQSRQQPEGGDQSGPSPDTEPETPRDQSGATPIAGSTRDAGVGDGSPTGTTGGTVDWQGLGTTAAWYALGAAGIGGGAVSGGWAIYGGLLAAKLLTHRLRRRRQPARNGTTPALRPVPSPNTSDIERQLAECREARIAQEDEAQRLRDALSAAQRDGGSSSAELAELRKQLEQSRVRVTELEQRHRELVIAYRDSYKEAVDLAEAALHRKDPVRWQQFLPAWRAMVDQFHSSIREERKHASNSPVHV